MLKYFLLIPIFLLAGCSTLVETGYFNPMPIVPAEEPKYCFDGSPFIPNAEPFIYGGCDLSIPKTPELMSKYKSLGITWNKTSTNHLHVAFGGKSLLPPAPGTKEYSNIILGIGVTNKLYPQIGNSNQKP